MVVEVFQIFFVVIENLIISVMLIGKFAVFSFKISALIVVKEPYITEN